MVVFSCCMKDSSHKICGSLLHTYDPESDCYLRGYGLSADMFSKLLIYKSCLRTFTIGFICKGSFLMNTDTPISDRTPLDLCCSLLITWPRLYAQDVRNLLLVLRSITLWWVSFLILKFVWEVACSWHCPTAERFFSMHNVSTGSSGFPPLSEMARHPIHYPRIREKCAFHFAKI